VELAMANEGREEEEEEEEEEGREGIT